MYVCKDVWIYICMNIYIYVCMNIYIYKCYLSSIWILQVEIKKKDMLECFKMQKCNIMWMKVFVCVYTHIDTHTHTSYI